MDKENVVYIHYRMFLVIKTIKSNYATCRQGDETRDQHSKQNKPDSESQLSHFVPYVNLKKYFQKERRHDRKVDGRLLGK